MAKKLWGLVIASALLAYYVYSPIPENIEERWKLVIGGALLRTAHYMTTFAEMLGFAHHMEIQNMFSRVANTAAVSDANTTVEDMEFNGVPVRLYIPKGQPELLKRALIFIHGGGFFLGDAALKPFDLLSRLTSERLNAVIVSVNYRLVPKYRFPVQFEDVYTVAKYFLQSSVLKEYNVEPSRVGISGDSAGGTLAAAVTQQLLHDPEVKVKFKLQALHYPSLQMIDLNLPSYQENENMPILTKPLMLRMWSEYFTADRCLEEALARSQFVPAESSSLFKFVNWSNWLPERFKKGHIYTSPAHGSSTFAEKYPGLLDPKAAPLLVDDVKLRGLPLTYVVTCQYDVLRDDGLMYVSRLREAGVPVFHHHAEDAVHGALTFISSPFVLRMGQKMADIYIEWLDKNL